MAACTFALSPSSANVVVCKRTVLRLRHQADARAARVGANVNNQSAGGLAAKGLTGKHLLGENQILKAIPCARYSSLDGTVCVKNQANRYHASVASPQPRQRSGSSLRRAT